MLKQFGIVQNLFYDPELHDPSAPVSGEGVDDLRLYAGEVFGRFLLSLAFDMSEHEADYLAWRGLRRTMVLYFLGSSLQSQGLKYPYSTLMDILVEDSCSERTKARFRNQAVVNLTGRRGDGMFHDKICETCVRAAKTCMRGCHGRLDALLVEKLMSGVSVMEKMCSHNRDSLGMFGAGVEGSHDHVGDHVRQILEERVANANPFGQRVQNIEYAERVRGSPHHKLKLSEVERFLAKVKKSYYEKY